MSDVVDEVPVAMIELARHAQYYARVESPDGSSAWGWIERFGSSSGDPFTPFRITLRSLGGDLRVLRCAAHDTVTLYSEPPIPS